MLREADEQAMAGWGFLRKTDVVSNTQARQFIRKEVIVCRGGLPALSHQFLHLLHNPRRVNALVGILFPEAATAFFMGAQVGKFGS